jgi:glutamine cyclotransferase
LTIRGDFCILNMLKRKNKVFETFVRETSDENNSIKGCNMIKVKNLEAFCYAALSLLLSLYAGNFAVAGQVDSDGNGLPDIALERQTILDSCEYPVALDTGDVINTIPAPGSRCQGMTFDGEYLWVSDYQTDLLYQISTDDGTVQRYITAPGDYVEGMAFDGTYLWASDNNGEGNNSDVIYKLDPANGDIILALDIDLNWTHGITWDGEYIWANDFDTHRIYKLNPDNGQIITSIPTSSGSIGLTWDGMYLWTDDLSTDDLRKLDPLTGDVLLYVNSPHTNPRDMAWDGYYVWVLAWQNATIYQVDVGGPPTAVDNHDRMPSSLNLISNYPNPFNAITTIRYNLPVASDVVIDIYDILGRKVRILEDERKQAGTHVVDFDASGLASGIYFYRLQTGDVVESKGMLLLK